MDMISNLPDELICHIVSFLSAKEAAFALVLSKRWLDLFTIIPRLHFKDRSKKKVQGSLIDFVNGVIALPLSCRIKEVSLRCREPVDSLLINRFLCNVLNRGILSVKLDLTVEEGYSLPSEIFTCKTIVELRLGSGLAIDTLPENAFLPALETLLLCSVRFCSLYECEFQRLLSACPKLLGLVIDGVDWEHWKWSRTISSPTLERLIIKRPSYHGFDGSDFSSITFNTPSLRCLDYSDLVPQEYPIVNLDSITQASLDLALTVDHTWQDYANNGASFTSDPTNLIKGLTNVRRLDLLSPHTLETFYHFRESIPLFKNLCDLSLQMGYDCCAWRLLPFLLNNSPNLQILTIKGPLHYNEPLVDYSCLLSCPVKVLQISLFIGYEISNQMSLIKLFLGSLPCLELLKVSVLHPRYKVKQPLTVDLLTLPRASSKCKIGINYH